MPALEISAEAPAVALAGWLQGAAVAPADLPAPWQDLLAAAQARLAEHQGFRPAALEAALQQSAGDLSTIRQQINAAAAGLLTGGRRADLPLALIPELPAGVQLTPAQERAARDAGKFIDEYAAFARQASPMTPGSFHQAAGLDIISKAVARRLHVAVSTTTNYIFPNLYQLYIGPSTRERKSTAQAVERGLLTAAGLDHLLLPSRHSAEAFMLELSTNLPPTYNNWPAEVQQHWCQSRAFAAQRGFLLSEAAHLLESFNRDYSSGLLTLLLDLYDCPDPYEPRNSVSRGWEFIKKPYITIFGSTTYAAMGPYLKNAGHWGNGLFARFALIGGDGTGQWQFWSEPLTYPAALTRKIQFLAYDLLPLPLARLAETKADGPEGGTRLQVLIEPELQSTAVEIEPAAWTQWERYSKAVGWDLLAPTSQRLVPERLHPSYGRLGTLLIKVATLLAALDAARLPVVIQPAHVYRAQSITETWRANLHRLTAELRRLNTDDDVQDLRAALTAAQGAWVGGRELYRTLGLSKEDLEKAIKALGESVEVRERQGRGPKSLEYRLRGEPTPTAGN